MTKRLEKGLVHIYTGNGKGKTTAAFGLGMRAVGGGLGVICFQFLKGKDQSYGELKAVSKLGPKFNVVTLGTTHPYFLPPAERRKARYELKKSTRLAMGTIKKVMASQRYDLIILDELVTAMRDGFIDLESVLDLIDSKPKSTELVLTGRGAPKALKKHADYVTEMRNIKHPYGKGMKARRGIEF